MQVGRSVIRTGLEALYFSGAHHVLRPWCGGVGAILTLHHVRPARTEAFQPSRALEVTPGFLEAALLALRRMGLETISLEEMHARLTGGDPCSRFVCITFDDGYRDNLEWAYPILKRHRVPFAIYVTSEVPDRRGCLWWRTIEQAVAARREIELEICGEKRRFACRTTAEKHMAVAALHRLFRALPHDSQLRATVADLAVRAGIDECAATAALGLSWADLRELASDSLVTIGAHTVSHPILCKTDADVARREMTEGAKRINDMLGRRPTHFSYPHGDPGAAGPREFALAREAGFRTAVTTRPGVLFAEHREHLWALPRISLNGEMQRLRYLQVLASGTGTALFNRFRRVNVT
jgi:peptidoglycan/xylan/chitin deacetylase (PgdA/CDA1 family)